MTKFLQDKVAIVTGGSRGIGQEIARQLVNEGAAVAVSYRSGHKEAEAFVSEMTGAGARAAAFSCDVSDPKNVRRFFDDAETAYGRPDIVVANAGTAIPEVPVIEVTDEDFEEVTRTNLYGAFYTLREAARRVRDGGHIIAISSTRAVQPAAGGVAYGGSKAAVNQYVACLAQELGARGITVNAVMAGAVGDSGVTKDYDRKILQRMADASPLGRVGRSKDIAAVVLLVASPGARWITGQAIAADGGLRL